jgi:predicted PurR-regulated permease PerM
MENETLLPKTDAATIFYTLASLTLAVIGLIYLESILKPLIIAFFVWFIIHRVKLLLDKININGKHLPSLINNVLALLIIAGIIYLITELVIVNLEGLVTSMPEYIAELNRSYEDASTLLNDPKYAEYFQKWIDGLDLTGMARSLVDSLSGVVANIAVVIVYVIFFLMEEATRKVKMEKLFPVKEKRYHRFTNNLKKINESIRFYIWSKTVISLITGALSYIILLIMNVDYAFLWSFLIFIFNFIPYIGPLISSLLPAIFAALAKGNLMNFVYVFTAMEGVQIILGNFIEPKFMGKGSNLGPVAVILVLAFWGMIWGIVGMILAVPIAALTVIICSQIPSARFLAILLSEKGDIGELEG